MTQQISTDTKEELLTVRMLEDKYIEFQAAAAVRGLSMSSLVTSWAFQLIREVKKETPEDFEIELANIIAKRQAKLHKSRQIAEEKTGKPDSENTLPVSHPSQHYPTGPYIRNKKKGGEK